MSKHSYTRALLFGACTLAFAAPAFAQNAADETATDNEIVVTAQNRTQNVNDVPIAINVISAEKLQSVGFSGLNDIDKIAPEVQLTQDQGTVKITVRGVGTTSNDEAQDTSVVVNIDGEYLNRPNVMSMAIFDMERVEVLRGPQGTLYGRNSTGGAINFITRKPGNDFGVNATASYGSYNAIRLDGGIDIPFGEMGGLRVSGFYDERDGYIRHPSAPSFLIAPAGPNFLFGPVPAFAGGRSDDNKSYGGRVSIRLEPTDSLRIDLAAEFADRTYTPQAFATVNLNAAGNGPATANSCNSAGGGFIRIGPNYPQTLCFPQATNFLAAANREQYSAPAFGLGQLGQDTYAIRGRLAYEFSDAATLTYTGGYRSFSGDPTNFVTLPVTYRSFTYQSDSKTQSHELRLNGEAGGVTYQVGGFYFKEVIDNESCFFLPFAAGGTCFSYFRRDVSSDSKSLFGQVEVPLGETLTAVGGLRYTDNGRDGLYLNGAAGSRFTYNADGTLASVVRGSPFTNTALSGQGPGRKDLNAIFAQRVPLSVSESKVTWLAGLNYKPNADTLIFAKASTGFKGGGFDSIGNYKPESNTAFELGWKQSFGASSQHQFNLGAYHYNYKDLQVAVLLDTSIGGQIFNAGKAKIWGLEASGVIRLDDNNIFTASVNYLNTKYQELFASYAVFTVAGTGNDVTGIGDLDPLTAGNQAPNFAGNRREFSPEFIIALGYDHIFDIGDSGTLTASANTLIKSQYFTTFFNQQDGSQKAFTQTDLSLVYKPENGKFSVQAFVRNLENTRALTFGGYTAAGPDDVFNWQFGTPRTYGIRVGVDF